MLDSKRVQKCSLKQLSVKQRAAPSHSMALIIATPEVMHPSTVGQKHLLPYVKLKDHATAAEQCHAGPPKMVAMLIAKSQ